MFNSLEYQQILILLHDLGCNATEVKIYLQCLQMPPSSVQEIARKIKLNRVTTHSAIEELLTKGFLYETRKGKRRLVGAEPPTVLKQLIQKRENDLQLTKTNLDYVIKLLDKVQPIEPGKPTVTFNDEIVGLKKMLEETLQAKNEVLVFSYVELLAKLLEPDYLENYFKRRANKGIHTRLIFPPCPFAEKVNKKKDEYKIKIRLLPPELDWRAGIFSWNENLAFLSYTEQKVSCTIINNPDITHFFRNIIFELVWQQAEPLS